MSLITIKFTKRGVTNIGKNDLREVGRQAIYKAGEHWWKKYLHLHFMATGRFRYNYEARSWKYRMRKKKRGMNSERIKAIGEDLPLGFTGRTRESAKRKMKIEVKAPNYKRYVAHVILPTPALNFVPGLQDELRRLIPQEIRAMEKTFGVEFERQLRKRGRTGAVTKTYKAT